ncbi:hypothetical protein CAOG_07651 [Capsaspora owczarzaki ATCC 30864]|uniref:Uncharacterized protein n=1 Tax=Capsaspora owczarzaki (strain ATCC 30864) TaxID=595528 RepID=A0A0D2WWZ9_CAPO3|nr:hypothetical protein CAOG_07651 [Capsaspora owczarzaki ATCC 30864]KJE97208.1 hypothetical protein CAOG_007651 [Capsaspora owczarzaki ATCC 30864]|eukprot:XP_004343525.1 hypothetical protein CAOG_07651 [Capsaspora owczarzaki ATCC 30864]
MASAYNRPMPPTPPYKRTGCLDSTVKTMTSTRVAANARELWTTGELVPHSRVMDESVLCGKIVTGFLQGYAAQAAYDQWRVEHKVELLRPLPFELRTEPPPKEMLWPVGFEASVAAFHEAMKHAEAAWEDQRSYEEAHHHASASSKPSAAAGVGSSSS